MPWQVDSEVGIDVILSNSDRTIATLVINPVDYDALIVTPISHTQSSGGKWCIEFTITENIPPLSVNFLQELIVQNTNPPMSPIFGDPTIGLSGDDGWLVGDVVTVAMDLTVPETVFYRNGMVYSTQPMDSDPTNNWIVVIHLNRATL